MVRFAALVFSPTQELPAIGDTQYGADSWNGWWPCAAGPIDPFADYVLTHGRSGQQPPDGGFFPESGYVILRPAYSPCRRWSRDLH